MAKPPPQSDLMTPEPASRMRLAFHLKCGLKGSWRRSVPPTPAGDPEVAVGGIVLLPLIIGKSGAREKHTTSLDTTATPV